MLEEHCEIQRHLGLVKATHRRSNLLQTQPGQALLKMIAAGICNSDIRVVAGNKATIGEPERNVTLGHEGVGRIIALNESNTILQPDDLVAVLPHVHTYACTDGIDQRCRASSINPVCIGCGHTLHMGWDIDGCFTDYMLTTTRNLVRIPRRQLLLAHKQAPKLGEAIFAFVEPMLCVLSSYELARIELKSLSRELVPGRALVIGSGPIGLLHCLVLLERGFEVWLLDTRQRRVELARWCLNNRVNIFDPRKLRTGFDFVMVTASSADAVKTGERYVRHGGIVYLFAGLNTMERETMDKERLFFYEPLHRRARGIITTVRPASEDKSIVYLGHSGYFESLAPKAVTTVAANAAILDRVVTGIITGLMSPRIVSRLPGGVDWESEDGSPSLISVLNGLDFRDRHCKLFVLMDGKKNAEDERDFGIL